CMAPMRTVLTLSVLLTAVVCLAAGYLIGIRSNWMVAHTPFPPLPTPKLETPPTNPAPQVQTVLVKPPSPPPPPEPVQKPQPAKASATAEAALKAFLDAPDWSSRSAYVLFPEKIRPAMEAYSRQAPDGPTAYKSISLENSYTDKISGNTLFIYQVVTQARPTGIPVAVSETSNGWVVDWQTFVEFRDGFFLTFADGPAERSGIFHLLVKTPPPPRAENTENEFFFSFLIYPPFPDSQRLAYVEKNSETQKILSAATASGAVFTPVLEVKKCTAPDGKTYLKIIKVVASDWLPVDH
ncbi:MAG: hypothetical protein H8M99_03625, partial [Gloeobacteraceae cyanobacterium ES-bin-144]|nr:hypothetical protein [Verrucomicrobiales bacterium]